MVSGSAEADRDDPVALDQWAARKIQPIVVLYVVAVFAVFMALSLFVFHSDEAVKALAIALVGAGVATIPGLVERVEYQLTDSGLARRPLKTKNPGPFRDVFRWEELNHIVPMKHGFKYFKTPKETNPLRRFWKQHISDRYSGEVHVERSDLDRILATVERQRATTRTPD